jgi:transposase
VETLFANVAGLDVHLKSISCAVRCCQASGKLTTHVRSFGTMTGDLRALADYLRSMGVTHVALEATGVLWKPVWNILDGRFTLLLVNPRHLKRVPGRKTDVSDAQWLAQLLQCGLLKASFVPPRAVRQLRDLTRQRAQLSGEHTRVANRIHKVLEDANIKLQAVASDVLGKSGRAMLAALIAGEQNPENLAELALGVLRKKLVQLRQAMDGHCTEHHRWLLARLLSQLGYLERQSEQFDARTGRRLGDLLAQGVSARLDDIPGVNRRTIENVIAEIGTDMTVFPDAGHLCSWCGICPGNEESAGKRLRSRTGKGNRWLKRALTEAAWAAARAKGSYFQAQYRRLAARRGKKRALVAVGHTLLVVIYHMLKTDKEYQELGPDYFAKLEPERLRRHLVRRLQALGYDVTLAPREAQDSAE